MERRGAAPLIEERARGIQVEIKRVK